jgi:glycine cleavage system transcriptional repressor
MRVAVTAIGADRPGIAAAVTQVLYERGGNIEDSRMAILGGHFAMMLVVALPAGEDPAALEKALGAPARALDLVVAVRPVAERPPEQAGGAPHVVTVYGADRPGIVYRVSAALAARNVNITDLATRIVPGEPPVYAMIMEVTVPMGVDPATVEADLGAVARELGVDLSFHPLEDATL